jgi:glycosyltransferase involved in cell wall biosynthesis
MDSRKLCFVVDDLQFFITHRLDLAIELSKKYKIYLVCNIKNAVVTDLKLIKRNKITIHHLESRDGAKFFKGFVSYIFSLKKLIKKISPHFILYVTLEMSFIGAFMHYFINSKKSLFLITGLGQNFTAETLKYKLIVIAQKRVFSFLKYTKNYHFIFQNPDDLKTFVDLKIVAQSKAILIRGNGINIKSLNYKKREFDKKLVFLFASKLLLKAKGINEFVSAANIIKKQHDSAEFLVAGKYDDSAPDTINKYEYEDLISSEAISYLGEIPYEEMQKYFYTSSIFVMPSYGEGLPKVALEAAATGMPLIMTDVQGCRECVQANKNGYLIQPKDSNDLAQTMESCILNIQNLDAYGKNSSEMVAKEFSLELISEEFQKVLNL